MKAKELTLFSLLLAASIIAQLLETIYLPTVVIPGVKLGLANAVSLVLILYFPAREVVLNVILRTVTVSLLTGTFMSTIFIYSLLAGLSSTFVMLAVYHLGKKWFSFVGVSVCGALTHNLTQLTLALSLLGHPGLLIFLPWLLLAGLVAGLANGLLVNLLAPRLTEIWPAG
jgi:heptaprenyl diphosphate synthase